MYLIDACNLYLYGIAWKERVEISLVSLLLKIAESNHCRDIIVRLSYVTFVSVQTGIVQLSIHDPRIVYRRREGAFCSLEIIFLPLI